MVTQDVDYLRLENLRKARITLESLMRFGSTNLLPHDSKFSSESCLLYDALLAEDMIGKVEYL